MRDDDFRTPHAQHRIRRSNGERGHRGFATFLLVGGRHGCEDGRRKVEGHLGERLPAHHASGDCRQVKRGRHRSVPSGVGVLRRGAHRILEPHVAALGRTHQFL